MVGAVASLAVAAPAFAIEFGPPVTVSPPETVFGGSPAVGVNAAGDVVVAWADVFPGGVYAAYRPRDGSFSAPQRLTARRRVEGTDVAVAVTASGTSTTCCQLIEAAVRPAGGAFGPAETLTEADARDFAVLRDVEGASSRWGALGWNGSALLLFERPEAGAFAAALAVPGALGEFTESALALAPDGSASVVKGVPLAAGAPCESVGGTYALATTSRPAGGVFGPDHLLTPADQPGAHADAAHAGARAIFSWEQPRRSAIEEREPGGCNFLGTKPFGADGAPGADPAPGVRASGIPVDGRSPSLAGDPAGMAVLAWIGGNERVRVARADGGSLGRDRYPDIVAPRLRRVRLQPRRVPPGGRLRLGFRLSERAVVTVRIARRGRRFGSFRGVRGGGTVRISLRAPARRGVYFVEVRARDRAGNPASPLVLEAFSVR